MTRTLLTALLLAPLALVLSACGDCKDCASCKDAPAKSAPAGGTTAAAAPSAAPGATAAAVDAEPEDGAPKAPPEVKVAWRGSGDVIELSVWEMHCGGCEATVEESLSALAGVKEVKADHTTALVRVTLAEAGQREALIGRIRSTLKERDFRVLGE